MSPHGPAAGPAARVAGPGGVTAPPARPARVPPEVPVLPLESVRRLRRLVQPRPKPAAERGRSQNRDLADVVTVVLGTGLRLGEVLALRAGDLSLDGPRPVVEVGATVVEPRRGYVEHLHRQVLPLAHPARRRLVLPLALVELAERRLADPLDEDALLFPSDRGTLLWPTNLRTRLRVVVSTHPELRGTTPDTLRRTVGDVVDRHLGTVASDRVLGRSTPGATSTGNVGSALDVRDVVQPFLD